MTKVTESVDVAAPAEKVWAIMGAPESICDWHPGIVTSPITGGVRHCTLPGDAKVEEPIVEHSDADRFYVYSITESPFDMTGYRSRIHVEDAAGGSRVVWTGEFEADDPAQADMLAGAFTGVYQAGLQSIKDLSEKS